MHLCYTGNIARDYIKPNDMTIKTAGGESYSVTGQGQGTYNTVAGSAGLAAFLGLNAGNILNGTGNNMYNRGVAAPVEVITSDDRAVSRYEASMMDKLASKESEISLLKSEKYTDEKIVEVTKYLDGKVETLAAEVRSNKEAQAAINMQQATYNGVNTATIQCMQAQIAQLLGLTKLVVPNASVCPGWGNVNITPSTTATTTPAA